MSDVIPGYRAVRSADGVLTIRDVPIFVECTRGDMVFDVTWINNAVEKSKIAERDGYLPPLHVQHHKAGALLTDAVKAAGFFRITGTKRITFKGEPRIAVMADLTITDAGVSADVLQKRLPYRSVEILDRAVASIDSLALLDHAAPYLELPMLMIGALEDQTANAPRMFALGEMSSPWRNGTGVAEPLFFRRGRGGHLIYEELITMGADKSVKAAADELPSKTGGEGVPGDGTQPNGPDKDGSVDGPKKAAAAPSQSADSGGTPDAPKSPPASAPPTGSTGAAGAGSTPADPDPPEATSTPAAAVVSAIEDGTISIADVAAIVAAIAAYKAKQNQPASTDAASGVPARANVPGGESMSAQPNVNPQAAGVAGQPEKMVAAGVDPVEFGKLTGKIAALEGTLAERDATSKREKDVATALKRLEGRPMGATPEATLTKYHTDHGPVAFAAHVDTLATMFGALPRSSGADAAAFAGQSLTDASEVAMAFTDRGTDAVAKAVAFSREWKVQFDAGYTRMSEERYVAVNMERAGFKPKAPKAAG